MGVPQAPPFIYNNVMKIIHFDEIDSTNSYLIREVDKLDNMTLVETNYQTNGKGREERIWLANKNENVMFSILIKDKELIDKYPALSMLSALLVRNFLESKGVKDCMVKWPNDVYADGKKICGMLLQGQIPNYLVIGIGINVNQKEFLGKYRSVPTSLALETRKIVDLEAFKKDLYKYIEEKLDQFKKGLYEPINEIRKYNYLKDKVIEQGKVLDINDDYSLKVESSNGIISLSSGEANI